MTRRLLAAIDDTAAATPVLQTALGVAPLLGATVEALRIADEPGVTARAGAERLGVPLRTLAGDPLQEILRATEAVDVVGVVVGAHRQPVGGGPVGHIPRALASGTEKPVIVVPPTGPATSVRRVLIAIEGTPRRSRSLRRAVEVVGGQGLEIVVVHVDEEESIPLFSDQPQHEIEAYAREFLARYGPGVSDARLQLRAGEAATEILAAADEIDPDLIVVGWPHDGVTEHGHVAREVLHRSARPVLLVAFVNDGV